MTKNSTAFKRKRWQAPEVLLPEPEPPYPKVHGITGPISEDLPEEGDIILSKELMDTITAYGVHEDDELAQQTKEKIIEKLEALFKEWLVEMCIEMNVPDIVKENVGGKIFPFGSFRLGVSSKDSDIDALCVGPGFIERKQFFSSFYKKLEAQKEVTDMKGIEEAFVPILKLTYEGQEIDLIYAMYPRRSVPEKINLMDDSFIKDLEARCVRSFNGYRVTEEILRLVPNVFSFRQTLRVIKLWAKQRQIYSNILGYLGGISWAILVARVCQVYPNATVATLVVKFFKIYNMWDWHSPIRLRIVNHINCKFPFWDPRMHWRDGLHLFPIITPAYPQQNTSYNLTVSNLTIIKEEFQRGHAIMELINMKKAAWGKLFEKEVLKDKYQYSVVVEAFCIPESCRSQWVGFVESKIRHLVGILDGQLGIKMVRIDPNSFPGPTNLHNGKSTSTMWLLGLVVNNDVMHGRPLNIQAALHSYTEYVYELARSSGLFQEGMKISATLRNWGQQVQCVLPPKRKLFSDNGTIAKNAAFDLPPAPKLRKKVKHSQKPSPSAATTSTGTPNTNLDIATTTKSDLPLNKDDNTTGLDRLATSSNTLPSEEATPSRKRLRSPEVKTSDKKLKVDLTPDIDLVEPSHCFQPKIKKNSIKLTLLSHKR